MKLALIVVVVVLLSTIVIGVVGYLIDRGTERHAGGDRS
jgi:hypothetical protein